MATVRTNLCTNPNAELNADGWSAYSAVAAPTRVTTTPFSGTGRLSAVGNNTGTTPRIMILVPGVAGDTITYTARVRSDGQTPLTIFAGLKSSPSGVSFSTAVAAWAPDANGWQLITATGTMPAGDIAFQVMPGVACGAFYTGTLGVDEVLIEHGTVAGAYFDGNSPYSVWSGTPNASLSVQTIGGLALQVFTDAPCPRVGVTVDTLAPGAPSVVTVWRSSPGGKRRTVRGARRRSIIGSDYIVDFEVPIGRVVTYDLELISGALVPAVTSAQVTVTSDVGWVQDPLIPFGAVPVSGSMSGSRAILTAGAFAALTSAMDMDLMSIAGSDEPVALGGQRMAASGVDFSMLTTAAEQGAALRSVLRTAFPVLVRPLPQWGPLPDVAYLASGSIVEQPLAPGGVLTRFTCVGAVVAPSSMDILVPIWSYADVDALYATYSEAQARAIARGMSYLDALKDPTMGGV